MTRTEKIEEFLSNLDTEIDVLDYVDTDNVECYDDVYDHINENGGFDEEIIYYANAIEYLRKEDPGFTEALGIAKGRGFTCDNLNSEILAGLLKGERLREEFSELEGEINDFFDALEEDDEDNE